MYNVATKINIEAREEHTLYDGSTAIIWEVKTYEFNELIELSFRITDGTHETDHCPFSGYVTCNNLFYARKHIKFMNEIRKEGGDEQWEL